MEITVPTSVGLVHLTQPSGTGSNLFHIMCNQFYHGQITKTSQGWKAYVSDNSELNANDREFLLHRVRHYFAIHNV